MLPDLTTKLRAYVDEFNAADEELYSEEIPNAQAFAYLKEVAPLLDCPDKALEKTYYFRWWTLRKHWRKTRFGHVLTEFMPFVLWAGRGNTINCPAGHHLMEARWLSDAPDRLWEYLNFWLDGHGNATRYSMWYASAAEAYFALYPDAQRMKEVLPKLDRLYRKQEKKHLRPCGLFWSSDVLDGMEYTVSGPGIRPSINSYLCGDAFAIARMAQGVGMDALAKAYRQRGEELKQRMDELLWDGDFYRTIPCGALDRADWKERPPVPDKHRVRELIGFLPWYFHLADSDKDAAFAQLFDPQGFASPVGLTTAERRHPRFLFYHPHECLWNGYVWPFASAQTLTAMANLIRDRGEGSPVTRDAYYQTLRQYALSHRITKDDGRTQCWIDEAQDPLTGRWSCRDVLAKKKLALFVGGRQRGKDYNHSTFCDLVLSGLLGIHRTDDGAWTADPILPESWDYFLVTGLTKDNWTVLYDRDGTHYGCGKGLQCFPGKARMTE